MTDNLNPSQRSKAMRAVKQKDSAPEKLVRSLCHQLGLRFLLHRRDLPGCPDLVFPKYKTCVFVHGCFWHQHLDCAKSKRPQTNAEFWNQNLDRNMARDAEVRALLSSLGWRVLTIWECQTKKLDILTSLVVTIPKTFRC